MNHPIIELDPTYDPEELTRAAQQQIGPQL